MQKANFKIQPLTNKFKMCSNMALKNVIVDNFGYINISKILDDNGLCFDLSKITCLDKNTPVNFRKESIPCGLEAYYFATEDIDIVRGLYIHPNIAIQLIMELLPNIIYDFSTLIYEVRNRNRRLKDKVVELVFGKQRISV